MNKKIIFLLIIFLFGCAPQPLTEDDRPPTATPSRQPSAVITSSPQSTPTIVPPSGTLPATETLSSPQTFVTITAVGGNLYIRRGPGEVYNRIGVLTNGTSAEVIGQDVLSKWAQIKIPNSDKTGWVSMMTKFSRVDEKLNLLPNFTFTEYPLPAYIKNCTEHELFVEPGEYYLFNLYTNANSYNEVKVNPGVYYVYDVNVIGLPLIETVDLSEGQTVYITVNGLGEGHKCP